MREPSRKSKTGASQKAPTAPKNTTTKNNIKLARQYRNARPFDITLCSADPRITATAFYLMDLFKSKSAYKRFYEDLYARHFILLVENLILNKGAWTAVMQKNGYYSSIPDRYNKQSIKTRPLKSIIKFMQAEGLLHVKKGYRSKKGGFASRIKTTRKLSLLFRSHGAYRCLISRYPDVETVELKDLEKKKIDYQDDESVEAMRRLIHDYNSFFEREVSVTEKSRPIQISLKRVFNNQNFRLGGRFYGAFQNLPAKRRTSLLINNESVAELDYSGMHIQMLYAKNKLPLFEGDVYSVKGYEGYRDLFKKVLQIALNAKNKSQAIQAARWTLVKEGLQKKIDPHALLDTFTEKHKPISNWLYSGVGLELQNLDSQMTEWILKKALAAKIPVLPIHDSFVTSQKYTIPIKLLMATASRRYLNLELKIKQKTST